MSERNLREQIARAIFDRVRLIDFLGCVSVDGGSLKEAADDILALLDAARAEGGAGDKGASQDSGQGSGPLPAANHEAPRDLLEAAKMALAYGLFTGAEAHDAREALTDAIAKAEGQPLAEASQDGVR